MVSVLPEKVGTFCVHQTSNYKILLRDGINCVGVFYSSVIPIFRQELVAPCSVQAHIWLLSWKFCDINLWKEYDWLARERRKQVNNTLETQQNNCWKKDIIDVTAPVDPTLSLSPLTLIKQGGPPGLVDGGGGGVESAALYIGCFTRPSLTAKVVFGKQPNFMVSEANERSITCMRFTAFDNWKSQKQYQHWKVDHALSPHKLSVTASVCQLLN